MILLAALALIMALPAAQATAGDTQLGASCDLMWLRAPDKQEFLRFDKELRAALSRGDAAALSLLAEFPLRVNYPDGGALLVANPRALQTRLNEIFPPRSRAVILRQKTADISCDDRGIMYGTGELWVSGEGDGTVVRYRLLSVNLRVPGGKWSVGHSGISFVCSTERLRAVVDTDASGRLRYRAWNRPRAPTDAPDLIVSGGTLRYEGSGVCSHSLWTFKKGTTEYVVSEEGCTDKTEGANGAIDVFIGDEKKQTLSCR